MSKFISLAGLFVMMFLAWLLSSNRRRLNWRLIISGIVLQFVLAFLILRTAGGRIVFEAARFFVSRLISFSQAGSAFVFGENFSEHFFAFSVLPSIIFVSSLTAVLFYLGILQRIVELFARMMSFLMDASGSESLAAASNVFIGMSESQIMVAPYIPTMTRSELMALMTGGMATISGATIAAYTGFGADAGHLVAASIISAPASLVIARIMIPETSVSRTKGHVKLSIERSDSGLIDAACRGATDGVKLAINIAAVVICFIAFVSMFNWFLGCLPDVFGSALTLERIFGWLFSPLAWLMGIEWSDAVLVGSLIGKKTVLNEFLAYLDLCSLKDSLSRRSFTIATYALCGFANFGSIAIQVAGLDTLVPARRSEFASLGIRAMIGGSLAAFMTACVAGMLI